MRKKETRIVTFYWWDAHGGMWAVKDENGMMRGWSPPLNTFEGALEKALRYLDYYKACWYGHPVEFKIDSSVFGKAEPQNI